MNLFYIILEFMKFSYLTRFVCQSNNNIHHVHGHPIVVYCLFETNCIIAWMDKIHIRCKTQAEQVSGKITILEMLGK